MKFKDWLLTEDFHASDSNQTGDAVYPTDAGDYAYANNDPSEHSWLQWKWDQEKKQGRKFFNIDYEDFQKRKYITLKSNTMPYERWRHKKDSQDNVEVIQIDDLSQIGIGKNSKHFNEVPTKKMIQWILPLNQIFKDKPSGSWQKAAENTRWKSN